MIGNRVLQAAAAGGAPAIYGITTDGVGDDYLHYSSNLLDHTTPENFCFACRIVAPTHNSVNTRYIYNEQHNQVQVYLQWDSGSSKWRVRFYTNGSNDHRITSTYEMTPGSEYTIMVAMENKTNFHLYINNVDRENSGITNIDSAPAQLGIYEQWVGRYYSNANSSMGDMIIRWIYWNYKAFIDITSQSIRDEFMSDNMNTTTDGANIDASNLPGILLNGVQGSGWNTSVGTKAVTFTENGIIAPAS